ncbi:MAG TPA: hypothetical protein VLE27_16525 [Thermoanaerobaculia bacterium]|nr:hypothetical protein [Thermoanaerobaculia bacterium]
MPVSYANWMEQTLDFAKTLKDISIPGSHDAGMYISINCSVGAGSCNTRTQNQTMLGQLQAGMRYFDLRPVWTTGVLYTGHFSSVAVLGTEGCDGGTLVDIFNDVTNFLGQGSKELVILKFSHYYDRDANVFSFNKSQYLTLVKLVTGMLGDWLYVNDTGSRLADIPLSQIIGASGKVLAVFDELPGDLVQSGIYQYSDYSPPAPPPGKTCGDQLGAVSGDLSVYDKFTGTNDLLTMETDQLDKLDCAVNHGGDLFLLSWTLTQSGGDATGCLLGLAPSIIDLAQQAIDSIESSLADHTITSANIPNIVYMDVSPTQATDACIAVNQRLGNNV